MTGMPRRHRETDAERRQREDLPWVRACLFAVAILICGGLALAMLRRDTVRVRLHEARKGV